MSKKDTTYFNMKITNTQKEIMDFVTEVIHKDMISKAGVVMELFKQEAYGYLGYPEEINLSDEMLLSALLNEKRQKDFDMIKFVGADKFEQYLQENKEKGNTENIEVFEQLLKEYKECNGKAKGGLYSE